MIKYWNKWEGINWLDLKKLKITTGNVLLPTKHQLFFLRLRRIFLKVTVPWGTQTMYSLAGYTHGKEINGLQSPKGPLTVSVCAIIPLEDLKAFLTRDQYPPFSILAP